MINMYVKLLTDISVQLIENIVVEVDEIQSCLLWLHCFVQIVFFERWFCSSDCWNGESEPWSAIQLVILHGSAEVYS